MEKPTNVIITYLFFALNPSDIYIYIYNIYYTFRHANIGYVGLNLTS